MDVFGHDSTLFVTLMENGMSKEEALRFIAEHGAKMTLVDNLRPTVIGEGVVPKGRGYSHFTDGCSMVLPFGTELKNYNDIHQTTFVHGEGYVNKFADQPTDFGMFIRMNPQMFTPENQDWGFFTLAHLEHDVHSDGVWQRELCKCDTVNDVVVYRRTGKVVDGKTFRTDMARANIFMHAMFVDYIRTQLRCDLTEQEFLDAIFASFDKWYTPEMASVSKSFFNLDHRIFAATSDEIDELVEEIIASGVFRNRNQLEGVTLRLFMSAKASLSTVMNLMVYSRK